MRLTMCYSNDKYSEYDMRITARLDDESEHNLELIQEVKGFKTVTDALKYSLQEVANNLDSTKPGDKMKALLNSNFVGSFEGNENVSVNYKKHVMEYLSEKYPQHSK